MLAGKTALKMGVQEAGMASILGTMSKLQRILHRQKEPGCPPGPTKSQCVEAHGGRGQSTLKTGKGQKLLKSQDQAKQT